MHAHLRFHRRLRVQRILDPIALLRDCKHVRIFDRVEGITLLLRAHSVADGEIVIQIEGGQQQGRDDK